jgi:uncharacterized protein (TIGR03435 family)
MLHLQHVAAFTASWCLLVATTAFAQAPIFEAASVKVSPSQTGRPSAQGGPGTADAGQITYNNVTLAAVLMRAYDVKSYQLIGPDWLTQRRYDIAAKLPPDTTKAQFGLMLQNLLAERFHLELHHETRALQGFELVVGKNGPKMKASTDTDTRSADLSSPPKRDTAGFPILDHPGLAMMEGVKGNAIVSFLTAKAQPISALIDMLSRDFRLPMVDKTGLAGKFDFTMEYAPRSPGALPLPPSMDDATTAADESAPNLTAAVSQQLGLKLNAAKIPLDVLIVDRADQLPTEN